MGWGVCGKLLADCAHSFLCLSLLKPHQLLQIQQRHCQIVGVVCFLLASRATVAPELQPTLQELTASSGQAFTPSDVQRMEVIVQEKLGGDYVRPTSFVFFHEIKQMIAPVSALANLSDPSDRLAQATFHYELLSFRVRLCCVAQGNRTRVKNKERLLRRKTTMEAAQHSKQRQFAKDEITHRQPSSHRSIFVCSIANSGINTGAGGGSGRA